MNLLSVRNLQQPPGVIRALAWASLSAVVSPFTGIPDAHAQIGIATLLNPEGSRLFPQSIIVPRHPGKPDPRWKSFKWKFTDRTVGTTNYRLYFYEEETWAAKFVLPRIDDQIRELTKVFNYSPSEEFTYVLFTSRREFSQANIFQVTEGVQGITSTQEATMAIPYWGEPDTFDHISRHELVHQFTVQKAKDLGDKFQVPLQLLPLWYVEGMAEYYSLHGIDAQTRFLIRDMLVNPDPDKKHEMPKFLEMGTPSFLTVYKAGQAKIDFLEKEFGEGTAQRILESGAKKLIGEYETFEAFLLAELKRTDKELEDAWQAYLKKHYVLPSNGISSQKITSFSKFEIEPAGDTLDHFDISPDGSMVAIREIDPLSGTGRIRLIDLKNGERSYEVAEDNQPDLLSVYFMQFPSLTVSDRWIAFSVETAAGPEIEIRSIERDGNGDARLRIGSPTRLELHKQGFLQISALAIDPTESNLAFVGLLPEGAVNVHVIEGLHSLENPTIRKLTEGYYGWRELDWEQGGILASSDRTATGATAIFRIDPENGTAERLSAADSRHGAPSGIPDDFVYEAQESRLADSPQINRQTAGQVIRLTYVDTGFFQPKLRNGFMYALGYRSGRYRLHRLPLDQLAQQPLPEDAYALHLLKAPPWSAALDPLPAATVEPYRAFFSSGVRLDNLGAFLASGGFGGVSATVSDLMRNYSISGELAFFGRLDLNSTSLFYSSQKGRSTWTLGAYHVVQQRLDSQFDFDQSIRFHLHREFGALAMFQYPLTVYSYFEVGSRLGGVNRSDFSDTGLLAEWETRNPGLEFLLAPVLRLGYDRVLYEAYTGPYRGYGALLESDTSFFPRRGATSERLRLDLAYYRPLVSTMVLSAQGIAGVAFGDRFRNSFLVLSDDILRAYFFGDDRLFGNYLLAAKTELRFPIGTLFGFPPLRGLAAYDLGTVFLRENDFARGITSSATGGLSLNIPPISINLMYTKPIRVAPGFEDPYVVHFTLRYLYL